MGAELTARFAALGAKVMEMDATEKLRVLHDFYRSGEEVYFRFDAQDMMRKGHDFRDYICPDSVEKHSDYLMLGGKYARVIYLKDYASFISDQLVTKLTDQSRSMMLSIDIIPVATDEAVREVERKMLGVETNITNWQRRQNANNNFSAIVPYDMEQQRRETKEYMTDLTSRDQRMMLSVLTIVHLADTKAELDADTDALLKVAADHMCQMAVLRYQQLDGLNTALPIGTRKIDTFRTLTTESLAVFMPFKVQEIQEPGGIYFGENAISHNLILCNMKNLLNQSMMLLGIPGSGKSFFAKLLIVAIALSTKDDIIILDPEGEYTPLVKALGGAVMCFAVGGSDWLNAMAMEEGYGEGSPVAFKSQFIMCRPRIRRNTAFILRRVTARNMRQIALRMVLPPQLVKLFIRWMCRGTASFMAHRGNPPNGRRIPSPSSPHHNRHRAVHNLPLIHLHPFLLSRCRIAPEQRTSTMHSSPTGYLPMGLLPLVWAGTLKLAPVFRFQSRKWCTSNRLLLPRQS